MNFKKVMSFVFIFLWLTNIPSLFAEDKIRIAATTTTFASIAQQITGKKAEIYAIAEPNQNIHFINPTPKDVLKTRKADVFIHGGLDLEVWRSPLLDAAGRAEFISGQRAIDVSRNVPLLHVPESLSRIHGDIHAHGNPHYWLDPQNSKIIAQNIAERLSVLYPADAAFFQTNAAAFEKRLDEKMEDWKNRLAPYQGQAVVCYHDSWPYFMERFGFKTIGFLEPKPGIPPTPRQILSILAQMKEHKVKVIVKQIFHENHTPQKVANHSGASVVTLASETGEVKSDYIAMTEHNVSELEKAFRKTAG